MNENSYFNWGGCECLIIEFR